MAVEVLLVLVVVAETAEVLVLRAVKNGNTYSISFRFSGSKDGGSGKGWLGGSCISGCDSGSGSRCANSSGSGTGNGGSFSVSGSGKRSRWCGVLLAVVVEVDYVGVVSRSISSGSSRRRMKK